VDRGSATVAFFRNDFLLTGIFLFSVEWIALATAVEENRAGFALFGGRLIMIGTEFFQTFSLPTF